MMRRKDKEILDRNIIDAIIHEADICRLGLCDGLIPYIVPMNFGYQNNTLYFHCANKGRKLDIIKKNNNVCFEIECNVEIVKADNPCEWTTKYYCIIGNGKAEVTEDYNEKVRALNIIMNKYSKQSKHEYTRDSINRISIIKVEICEISGKKSGY